MSKAPEGRKLEILQRLPAGATNVSQGWETMFAVLKMLSWSQIKKSE